MFPEESGPVQDSTERFFIDKSRHELDDATSRIEKRARRFEELTQKLGLKQLLDLPLVALSNGQTRRARIVKALLEQPEILLLDEPLSVCHVLILCTARLTKTPFFFLAGLDFKTRPTLLSLLHSVHVSNNPRIIMGLRLQDPIPEWISHIALVHGGHVMTGEKAAILEKLNLHTYEAARSVAGVRNRGSSAGSGILVDMQNVNVRYHERHVRWYFLSCASEVYWFAIGFKRY